jgi:hypothetical protein
MRFEDFNERELWQIWEWAHKDDGIYYMTSDDEDEAALMAELDEAMQDADLFVGGD